MAKVLVVDDNQFFRKLLCSAFNMQPDFEVCGDAENGKEAVERALKLQPDLVVLDLSMPVMNGIDAARVLRLMMPMLPIIMDSALEDPLAEQEVCHIGITGIVSKSAPEVIQAARRALWREPRAAA